MPHGCGGAARRVQGGSSHPPRRWLLAAAAEINMAASRVGHLQRVAAPRKAEATGRLSGEGVAAYLGQSDDGSAHAVFNETVEDLQRSALVGARPAACGRLACAKAKALVARWRQRALTLRRTAACGAK